MIEGPMTTSGNDDPRKLGALLSRISALAERHCVTSVVAGLASRGGGSAFPDFVDFLQATLRVEDAVFRMTRERVVLHLADVDADGAKGVLERLAGDFAGRFPSLSELGYDVRFFEVKPGDSEELRVKDVLVEIFPGRD